MDESYDRLWKMRTISDKLTDAYARSYSPAEHLEVDKINHFCLQTVCTKETRMVWDKNLQAM
jgi:hypothetical protein